MIIARSYLTSYFRRGYELQPFQNDIKPYGKSVFVVSNLDSNTLTGHPTILLE